MRGPSPSPATRPMVDERRRRTRRRGRQAEAVVAVWLRLKGYRVLARRYRSPVGELDIVARRGRILAIVEVKASTRLNDAAHAISAKQQRRIARAALYFQSAHRAHSRCQIRFDAVLVRPWRLPRHLVDAWAVEL